MRKAELDRNSKIWVAVVGAIIVGIQVAGTIIVATLR